MNHIFNLMTSRICRIILANICFLLISCSESKIEVGDLRCEYLTNPYAINTNAPRLSWRLLSSERGKAQTAYRIIVASNKEKLSDETGDYWDSGMVTSDQSQHIEYVGKELLSRQNVYWKVKVWDEKNNPSEWSEIAEWRIGLLHQSDWTAKWIANTLDSFPNDTKTYPVPYFRKTFPTHKKIKHASLYICGLGFYEAHINGQRIGSQVLAPAVTNYDKRTLKNLIYQYDDQSTQRVLYNAFDVTNQLKEGINSIGILLGNGWYNQRDRVVEGCMWYNTPRLIAQLEIVYENGKKEVIVSDESWKTATGPYLHDGIFTGEIYDARKELGDWLNTSYNDSRWFSPFTVPPPSGNLEAQMAPFDEIVHQLQPILEDKPNDSTYLFTLPYVVSGWVELSVSGKRGDQIAMNFLGEEGNDFGQQDSYIFKGDSIERWEPKFTWHTFRKFRVTAPRLSLTPRNFLVKVVNTNPRRIGRFSSSNELINRINEFYVRTQEANFHGSISSDCPHRERLAYTGDAQVAVEASLYTYDMTQFYRKWFNDFEDARNKNTGYVPHTAPFGGGGGGPAWGSAMVIMPWAYYCHYGDSSILRTHYRAMKHWVEYLGTRTDERGVVVREEPNGWCLGDWCTPGKVELPEPLVNTAYYYHVCRLMVNAATVLGRNDDIRLFLSLSEKIKSDFNNAFYHADKGRYWEGRQGANVLPLAFGLVEDQNRTTVFTHLLNQLDSLNYHFDTGILATPLLLSVLTDGGRADIAYRIMTQRTYPSFGYYMLDDQFTGMWEDWEGKSSYCHPMFGSVVAWFYRSLGGIQPDLHRPGMKHFIVAPSMIDGLNQVCCSYETLYGTIKCEWDRDNSTSVVQVAVEIPVNCSATLRIPADPLKTVYEGGSIVSKQKGIVSCSQEGDMKVINVLSGNYSFELK